MRATLRSSAAVAAGCALVAAALFADPLGLTSSPGFGWKQELGLAAGGVLLAAAAVLRRDALSVLGLAWFGSVVVFGLDIADDPEHQILGVRDSGDQAFFVWLLAWWPHAISDGLHPVMTEAIFEGAPYNLMRTTSIPLPSLIMWPLTAAAGPIVSYNVLMLAAPALATWTAYLLCRHLSGRWVPSLLGALVFGFSPYMAGHMVAHPNLVLVALVPVAALLVVRRFEGTLGRRRFVIALAAVLAAQFAISAEILVTIALFLAIALGLAAVWMPAVRPRIPRVGVESLAAGVLGLVLVAPLAYYALKTSDIEPYHSPLEYSGDLENLVVPPHVIALGGTVFYDVAERWTGNIGEDTLYLGLPLLAVAVWSWRRWPALVAFIAIAVILAFGAQLHVGGVVTGFDMPWDLADELPFIEYALPVRFGMYVFLALGVLVALVLRRGAGRRVWALVLAGVALLAPALETEQWRHPTNVPELFERDRPLDDRRVLLVPDGDGGEAMLYHALSEFSFDMAGGYAGVQPDWHLPGAYSILDNLETGEPHEDAAEELALYLSDRDVDLVALDLGRAKDGHRALLASLGEPRIDGGVALYEVP